MDTQLELADLDLSAPIATIWPLKAAARQYCFRAPPSGESMAGLAERVACEEARITAAADIRFRHFVVGLDQEIVGLSALWGGMPCQRYNWFASSPPAVRTYRIQVARIFPAIIPILSGELGAPGAIARSIGDIIDRGQPLAHVH